MVKRLSYGVEGQISVNEYLCETQVARKVECYLKQKTGYSQHTSLKKNRGKYHMLHIIESQMLHKSGHLEHGLLILKWLRCSYKS